MSGFRNQGSVIPRINGELRLDYSDILRTIRLTNISVERESDCHHHKFLVYVCDYSRSCGGLGDRQKGIVSAFLLAVATSRAFVINFETPCRIEKVFKQHLYNWSICRNFVNTISENETKLIDVMNQPTYKRPTKQVDFELEWQSQVIFLKINSNWIKYLQGRKEIKDHHSWLSEKPTVSIFSLILLTLFQPTKYILDYFEHFHRYHVQGKSLVCSHIRMGKNPTIPNDKQFEIKPNETVIFNFMQNFADPNKYVLYLASDSDYIRNEFYRKFDNSIKTNLSVQHIDILDKNLKRQACEGLKDAVIEQLTLSICDILLISHGGFGGNAAYLRGIDTNLYKYDFKSGRIKRKKLRHI
ncbi:uncharacterized protein LOC132739244 [Ruditapes philippinarum]|uniref:uncharacterized protein LOC132739244 n=1 Tax=Ruditapes philippinarum TaxID=129788 RepID=UPI00295BEBCB|nr:uncharacterized protein LOC132739244 [Ruditapes philippinarum]